MRLVLCAFITMFSILLEQKAMASHAMGADLTYEYLGNNTYRIVVKFYRYCGGDPAPTAPKVKIGSSCASTRTITLSLLSTREVSQLCSTATSNCNGGTNPGIQQYIYTAITTMQPCTDWVLTYQECCRNNNINNSTTPSFYDVFVQATLNNVLAPTNSSPYFTNYPVPYVCVGQPFTYNHGTVDVDGNSIVYSLVQPKSNPTSSVPYASGFSATYPISTTTGTFGFNTATGQMTFTPNAIQIGIVTVTAKEYNSSGQLVGSVQRDMEVLVTNCTNNTPVVSTPNNVLGGTYDAATKTFNVCAGNTLSFTLTATDADVGQILTTISRNINLMPGATLTTSGTNPQTINFNWHVPNGTSGNYNLGVETEDNNCPIKGFQSVGFVINVVGVKVTTAIAAICKGNATSIPLTTAADPSGGTYVWSPATGLSATNIANPIATVSDSVTYTVIYTQGGCSVSDKFVIKAGNATVNVTPAVSSNCAATPVNLAASFSYDGGTYPPTCPFTLTMSDAYGDGWNGGYVTVKVNGITIGNYSALGSKTTQILNIQNGATVQFSYTVGTNENENSYTIANGNTIVYTSTNTPATGIIYTTTTNCGTPPTYSWSPTTGLSSTNTANTTANPTNTTTYTVTVTAGAGCTAIGTAIVNVGGGANVNISPPAILTCANTSTQLTANSSASNYTWAGPGIVSGGSTSTPTINQPGTYSVTVFDGGSCTATTSVTVTKNNTVPDVSIAPPAQITCANPSVTLSASSTTSGATFTWSGGGTGNTKVVNSAGSYSVTVTDPNSGCTASASATVSASGNVPDVTIAPPAQITCTNTSVTLTASSTTSGATFTWSGGGTGNTKVVNSAGSYSVTVTDPNSGCTASASAAVSASGNVPDVSIAPPAQITCANPSVTLTASSTTSGVSFVWSGGGIGNTKVVNSAGSYSVTVTDPNSGCTASVSAAVSASGNVPDVSIAPPAQITCTNTSVTLTASSTTSGATFTWSGGGTGNTKVVNSAGSYSVTVTDPNSGCTASVSAAVSASGNVPDVSIAPPAQITCTNTSVTLTASSTTSGATFTWSGGGTGNTKVVNSAGSYSVTVTDPNSGCTASASATVSASGNVPDVFIAPPAQITCANPSVTLTASSTTSGVSFVWSGGDTGNTKVVNSAGSYSVTVTDPNSGCTASASATVVESGTLLVTSQFENPACAGNDNGAISLNVSGGLPPYTYLWNNNAATVSLHTLKPGNYNVTITDANGCTSIQSFVLTYSYSYTVSAMPNASIRIGETVQLYYSISGNIGSIVSEVWAPAASLSCSNCANPIASPANTTQYILRVTNNAGCYSESNIIIDVLTDNFSIYIPNLFSPNDDGSNDFFQIQGDLSTVALFEIQIFNRWGEKVFEAEDKNFSWDGVYKGVKLSPQVLTWQLKFGLKNGKVANLRKGALMLIR